MKSKTSSSKKKGPFIPYTPPHQDPPPQEESWAGNDINMSNNPTTGSWRVNLPTEDSSMAVDTQLTTGSPWTSKLSSHTVKEYPFTIQPLVHTERTETVNSTPSHNPHGQVAGNNMPAVNQPAISNVSVSHGNSPLLSAEATLNTSVLPYSDNQPADPNLWDGLFALTSLFGVDKFQSIDAQNIECSLLHIETFIKQCPLGNKPIKDFPNLAEAIYKLGWDRLSADNNNSSI